MMRRDALGALLALALSLVSVARAQKPMKIHRVGIFSIGTDPANPTPWSPFVNAMRKLGYEEGRNLALVPAFGGGDYVDRILKGANPQSFRSSN